MIDWLGIEHLFELSRTEAIAGFFTPLAVFAAFLLAQIILPARRVPGYVIDEKTGEPRSYRLNGLLVFLVALLVWWFELTGMPRDWFFRSTIYAVAGGTVFAAIFTAIAVFSQPRGPGKSLIAEFWTGRAREISLFKGRFDIKMYFYVVGGTMLALNALSGAAYHHDRFGDASNPGVYLYAGFFTFYVLDYFIFERVQLYTYDLIHEKLGFMLFWGGLIVYGWLFILPLWGMAAHPDPGFLDRMDLRLAYRDRGAVPAWLEHLPGSQPAEVHLQAMARPQVSWVDRAQVHRGRGTQDTLQRVMGSRPTLQLHG